MLLKQLHELKCVTAHYNLLRNKDEHFLIKAENLTADCLASDPASYLFELFKPWADYLNAFVFLSALICEVGDPHTCFSFTGLPCEGTLGSMTQGARAGSVKYQGALLGLSYVPAGHQNFSALHPCVLPLSTMGHRLHQEVTQPHGNKSIPWDINIRFPPQH